MAAGGDEQREGDADVRSRQAGDLQSVMSFTGDLAHALEESSGVRLAVMFGSAARGTARSDSDVDVGVLLDDDDGLPALRVALERVVGRSVDLVSLRTAPPLLRFE